MSAKGNRHNFFIQIPWGAWYGDETLTLSFPSRFDVHMLGIQDAPCLKGQDIRSALKFGVGGKALCEMAQGKEKVVVAVEDITRPSKLDQVLQAVLKELKIAGVKKENIAFLICAGAHVPMDTDGWMRKAGKVASMGFRMLNHNPWEHLSDTGHILWGGPVKINKHFLEADLRIAIGSIIPHPFAGFSSGAKLIIPGLSDFDTIKRCHKLVMMGFRTANIDPEKNKFRQEIENVVSEIGVDLFVGLVPNFYRDIAGIFVGDIIRAHREGVKFAQKIFRSEARRVYDVVVLNAYPKDMELIQTDAVFGALKRVNFKFVKQDGIVIVVTKSSLGLGGHLLFGPEKPLYRRPVKRRYLMERELVVFSPDIGEIEFHSMYWSGYKLAKTWKACLSLIEDRFQGNCHVGVFPCAPLQLVN